VGHLTFSQTGFIGSIGLGFGFPLGDLSDGNLPGVNINGRGVMSLTKT